MASEGELCRLRPGAGADELGKNPQRMGVGGDRYISIGRWLETRS